VWAKRSGVFSFPQLIFFLFFFPLLGKLEEGSCSPGSNTTFCREMLRDRLISLGHERPFQLRRRKGGVKVSSPALFFIFSSRSAAKSGSVSASFPFALCAFGIHEGFSFPETEGDASFPWFSSFSFVRVDSAATSFLAQGEKRPC